MTLTDRPQHDNGGPAFPRPASECTKNGTLPDGNDAVGEQDGMTLRDWFAGQCLAGYMANELLVKATAKGSVDGTASRSVAQACYEQADRMLDERKVKRPQL